MSTLDPVSGIGGSSLPPLSPTQAASLAAGEAKASTAKQAPGATDASAIKPPSGAAVVQKHAEPFLLVPTEPLSQAVLAELIGLQPPLKAAAAAQ